MASDTESTNSARNVELQTSYGAYKTELSDSKCDPEGGNGSLRRDVADDIMIECQFLCLALAAGILDATTFPEYGVFVSNQTGNTALLAVGALSLSENVKLENVGFSLGLFMVRRTNGCQGRTPPANRPAH